jgi:hypothetical protein
MSADGKKSKLKAALMSTTTLGAKAVENTAGTTPLLAPLKASMTSLIKLLDSIKAR